MDVHSGTEATIANDTCAATGCPGPKHPIPLAEVRYSRRKLCKRELTSRERGRPHGTHVDLQYITHRIFRAQEAGYGSHLPPSASKESASAIQVTASGAVSD